MPAWCAAPATGTVGSNLTYGIWLARAGADQAVLPFKLRGVKILDDRVANPSYGLLLVSGLAMAYVGGLPLTTPWIALSLVIYIALVLLAPFGWWRLRRRRTG